MKKIFCIIGLIAGTAGYAQADQHFSMFTASPVYLNPAAAGFTEGDLRLFTNYRLQWSTVSDEPYRTISASADWRMFDQGGSYMGAGLNFYNDVAGVTNYTVNVINLPLNYSLRYSENSFLSFGIQPAFYQRSIKNQNVNWGNQWTGLQFDQGVSSGESLLNQNFNVSRFDIGAGVYWDAYLTKYKKIKLGVSGQHLTKQRINFTGEDTRLYRRLNIHGEAELSKPTSNVTVMPAFVAFVQGPNTEIVAGSGFRFLLKSASRTTSYFEEVNLTLGTYFRVRDAVIISAMFDISGFSFGASYDMNVSSLSTATKGVGAMEFFLRYRMQFGTRNLRNNRVK